MSWIKFGLVAVGLVVFTFYAAPSRVAAPDRVNLLNADTEIDRADSVLISVSTQQMRWKDSVWPVYANQHTPRGRFRVAAAEPSEQFGNAPGSIVLPFLVLPASQVPRDNPQYQSQLQDGVDFMAYAIHSDNRQPGAVGAGCILTDERSLVDMASKIQGATIVITD